MRKGMLGLLLAALLLASVSGTAWAEDAPRVIGEEAYSGSLEYAVNETDSSSSAVALALERIAGVYGESSVRVQSALPGEDYSLAKPENGVVMLEADGVKRLVIVEDGEGKKVLWAGVSSGGEEAPRAMLSWWSREASDGGEKGLTLDLSEVAEACERPLLVQVAADDFTYDVPEADGGIYHVDGEAENWFVLIGTGTNMNRDYLWAGVIPGDAAQGTAVFQVHSEDFFDPGHIPQPTAEPTPEPTVEPTPEPTAEPDQTPEPTAAPVLALDQAAAIRTQGTVAFAGSVSCEVPADGWELYVNGELCRQAEWTGQGEETAAFAVRDYPVDEDAESLTVFVQAAGQEDRRSREEVLRVESAVREYTVTVTQETDVYDGRPHTVKASSEEPDVTYYYALCGKNDWRPGENWVMGLPRQVNAGETWAFLRAEKADAVAVYVDENGKPIGNGGGYVKVLLNVEPAPVTLSLWAEQEGEAVYTGEEQTLRMRFEADLVEDSGLFDLRALEQADGWIGETQVTGSEAGDYPIEPTDEQLAFIRSFDPNFDITVRWRRSAARIEPLSVRLESASAAGLYDPAGEPLTSDDPIKGVQDLVAGDYFSGNLMAAGEQTQAGVGRNTIVLSGRFEERQHNYAFDLEEGAGVLVVFPQSISKDDEAWDPSKADEKAAAYADTPDSELPGYYAGMRVELTEDTFSYDGMEKDIGVRFLNRQGSALKLTEGVDYTLGFFRDGEQTEDLSSPGEITVRIEGIGNYRGTVEQSVRIRMSDKNALVSLDSWVYDGMAAGSTAHEPEVSGPDAEAVYAYYDESGEKISAPSDAGTYRLTVSWPETDVSPAMEVECRFTISPAEAKIYAGGGEKTYGDSDPVLKVAKVEGLLEGDSIPCGIAREEGEDAGVYDTLPTLNGEQDNYLVTFVNGSFRIRPRPLDDGGVEVLWQEGEQPEVRWNGELLEPGSDYTVQVDEDGGRQRAVITGKGNFTGQRTETREVAVEAALSLTDGDGAPLPAEGLTVGRDGVLAVDGAVRLNVPVDSDRLAVQVNGQKASARWTGVDEVTYAFSLRMDDPGEDELRVSVLLDGEEADAQSAPIRRGNGAALWMALTAALAVCSLACLIACLCLTKHLRREREKLLDETGRHSTRTIRMSNDEDS